MGLFDKKYKFNELNISSAKQAVYTLSNEESRKRAFVSFLGLEVLLNELKGQKVSITTENTLHSVEKFLDEFELADIWAYHARVDVRVVIADEYPQLWVPRSHYKYGLQPDIYVGVLVNKNLSEAELIGFVETKTLLTSNGNANYYFVDAANLKPISKLKSVLKSFALPAPTIASPHHEKAQELFNDYINNTIRVKDKESLIKHLATCSDCRRDFNLFYDFNKITQHISNYPELTKDYTLDIFTGTFPAQGAPVTIDLTEEHEEKPQTESASNNTNIIAPVIIPAPIPTPPIAEGIAAAGAIGGMAANIVSGISNIELPSEKEMFDSNELEDLLSELENGEDDSNSTEKESSFENTISELDPIEEPVTSELSLDDLEVFEAQEEAPDAELILDELETPQEEPVTSELSLDDLEIFEAQEENADAELILDELETPQKEPVTSELSLDDLEVFEAQEESPIFVENADAELILDELESSEPEELKLNEEDDLILFEEPETNTSSKNLSPSIMDTILTQAIIEENQITNDFEEQSPSLKEDIQTEFDLFTSNEEPSGEDDIDDLSELAGMFDDFNDSHSGAEKQEFNQDEITSDAEPQGVESHANLEELDPELLDILNEDSNENEESDISDEDLMSLLSENEGSSSENDFIDFDNISGLEQNSNKQPLNLSKYKKIIPIASAVAVIGILAGAGVVFMQNNNTETAPQQVAATNQMPQEIPAELDKLHLTGPSHPITSNPQAMPGGTPEAMPGAMPAQETMPTPVTASQPASSNINDALTHAVSGGHNSVRISKLSWEVGASVANNGVLKKYLMQAGRALKLNLSDELLLTSGKPTNKVIKVQIKFKQTGDVDSLQIKSSSGSKQIDAIVLQTVKDTLTYTKLPIIHTNKPYINTILVINL